MGSLTPLLITILVAAQILAPAIYNEDYSVQQEGLSTPYVASPSSLDPRPGLSAAGFRS